ncbi:MAG: ATP-binding cassette domain-containing protein [Bacteroidota bacterium]
MSLPLHIQLQKVGKQYYRRWIFRDINLDLVQHPQTALVGTNGSGKSTLLRIIAGQLAPTEGKISFAKDQEHLPIAKVYQHLSWAGPQIEMYAELTLEELIKLHFQLKNCLLDKPMDLVELLRFKGHHQKPLKYFSSGMQQRAKVGIALFSQSELLLLDEPTSNMDEANAAMILDMIDQYRQGRIFVLASNMKREYERLPHTLHLN